MSPAISMSNSSIRPETENPLLRPARRHHRVRCGIASDGPFAVRSGTAEPIEHDIRVADYGHEERVLNADVIGDDPLHDGQNRAADDGHVEKAGPRSVRLPSSATPRLKMV